MAAVYIKIFGYNTFYKGIFTVRKSYIGYRIAHLEVKTEISKAEYYKIPAENRLIFRGDINRDIREIGHSGLLSLLEAEGN